MANKQDLIAEMNKLEAELESYGSAVAESQIWHKKARIEQIKQEIKKLETQQFNSSNEKLQEVMAQKQPQQLSPEQIAAANAGRQ